MLCFVLCVELFTLLGLKRSRREVKERGDQWIRIGSLEVGTLEVQVFLRETHCDDFIILKFCYTVAKVLLQEYRKPNGPQSIYVYCRYQIQYMKWALSMNRAIFIIIIMCLQYDDIQRPWVEVDQYLLLYYNYIIYMKFIAISGT